MYPYQGNPNLWVIGNKIHSFEKYISFVCCRNGIRQWTWAKSMWSTHTWSLHSELSHLYLKEGRLLDKDPSPNTYPGSSPASLQLQLFQSLKGGRGALWRCLTLPVPFLLSRMASHHTEFPPSACNFKKILAGCRCPRVASAHRPEEHRMMGTEANQGSTVTQKPKI